MKVFQIVLKSSDDFAGAALDALRKNLCGASNYKPEHAQYFQHVATLDTEDMEEAFRLMNLWDEPERVQRHMPLHSLSVGDILELATGERFIVDTFGFLPLPKEILK